MAKVSNANSKKATDKNSNREKALPENNSANTGFIFGLISIIAWILPLIGYPITICGIVFSVKGFKSKTAKTKAIIGLVLSILFLLVTLGNSILGVIQALQPTAF